MTSRNLFFKLMREDAKRRLWAISFSILALFFAMPMTAAMGIGAIEKQYADWLVNGTGYAEIGADALRQTKLLRLASQVLGFENYFLCVLVAAAAMILGLTGFLYLHSKKQVDFYNCLPVKREQLFAVKFLDGFLIILAAYLINMIVSFAIFCGNGLQAGMIAKMMLAAFGVHMAGFLLIYAVMVIAVMLTGNLFISVLGAGVLYGYFPAIALLLSCLQELFFVTTGRNSDLSWIAVYGSPIGYYGKLMAAGLEVFHSDQFYEDIDYRFSRIQMRLDTVTQTGNGLAKLCVIGLLAAVLLSVIALFLYKLRPSEAAGKAMAFKKSQALIKVLILIPVTAGTTVLLWTIYYSLIWGAVGFVLGLVLTSCIIEIIYHFDFAKLFANPVQTVIGGALALVLIAVFWTDAIGYDSYLPSEKKFESASINFYLDDVNYGLPYRNEGRYGWKYLDANDYADANMKLTDYAKVMAFAEQGVEQAKLQRERKIAGDNTDLYGTDTYMVYAQVGYHLKNGKTVYRTYHMPREVLGNSLDEIYALREYKEGIYPVMSYTAENLSGIYYMTDNDTIDPLDADDAMKQELLTAYQEDLANLTLNERAVEVPVAALRFLTNAEEEYLCSISAQRRNRTSGFDLADMNDVNFFPVYPSFTKTLALLKQAGADLEKISVDEVAEIRITYPEEYKNLETASSEGTGNSGQEYAMTADHVSEMGSAQAVVVDSTYSGDDGGTITIINDGTEENRKAIEEILFCSAPRSMVQKNDLCSYENGLGIYVVMKQKLTGSGSDTEDVRDYLIVGDTVPEYLNRALKYDQISDKYVHRGIGVIENN